MSSSSSSDSEDDTRFREACDPNLSILYDKDDVRRTSSQKAEDRGQDLPKTTPLPKTETRESFILAHKVQTILAMEGNKKGPVVNDSYLTTGCPQSLSHWHRRRNNSNNDDLPSALSPYLAKQLVKLLDTRVEMEATDDIVEDSLEVKDSKSGIFLLKNSTVKLCTNNVDHTEVKRQKRHPIRDSYNQKEVAVRCQSVAISPQYILDRRDVYPWPHPKNIRYLDKYKIKSRKPDGCIEAVPYEDSVLSTKKSRKIQKKNSLKEEKLVENSVRPNEKRTLMEKGKEIALVNGHHDIGKEDTVVCNGIKRRKQTKKRGGKKQRKKSSSNINELITCNKN